MKWLSEFFNRYGHTILDLGCGPGFATVELAELVGPQGKIIAIDASEKYLSYLETLKKVLWLDNIEVCKGDLHDLALPDGNADGAYARWVMCFVKDPKNIIQRVAQILRPGGVFAINDCLPPWKKSNSGGIGKNVKRTRMRI